MLTPENNTILLINYTSEFIGTEGRLMVVIGSIGRGVGSDCRWM